MTEKQHHGFKTKQSEDASGQDTEKSTTTILDANVSKANTSSRRFSDTSNISNVTKVTSVNSVVSDVSTKEKKMLRNELLAFVVSKLNHTMPPVTLVQLCSQFYTDEEIIAASKLLYDTCAVNDDPRHRKRQGVNRKKATMEDIVSLIERKGGI